MTQRYLRMRFRLLNSIQSLLRSCFHVFSLFSSLQEVQWKFKELRRHSTGMINVPFCNLQDVGGGNVHIRDISYSTRFTGWKTQGSPDISDIIHWMPWMLHCFEQWSGLSYSSFPGRPTFFSNASWLLSTFSARFCTRPVTWLQRFAWFCMHRWYDFIPWGQGSHGDPKLFSPHGYWTLER